MSANQNYPPQFDHSLENINAKYSTSNFCLMWMGYPRDERQLSGEEKKRLLKVKGAYILRNLYDFDSKTPTNFWEVINDRKFEIADLSSKVRNQVRRCYKDCEIRHISNIELIDSDGYEVYVSSYSRYKDVIKPPVSRETFERKLRHDGHLDIYAVFRKEDNQCIAYAWNVIDKDIVKYSALKANPKYLNKHYPFYGLLFHMTREYLDQGYKYVTDGFRSMTSHSNIQPFLEEKFLFRKAYCKMNIEYIWWLKILIYCAYPFRKLLRNRKIQALLNMESIRREQQ